MTIPGEKRVGSVSHVRLADLVDLRFFLTEKDANYRYALEQHLAAERMQIHPFFETGNTEVLIRLVKENQGISFCRRFPYRTPSSAGSCVRSRSTTST